MQDRRVICAWALYIMQICFAFVYSSPTLWSASGTHDDAEHARTIVLTSSWDIVPQLTDDPAVRL